MRRYSALPQLQSADDLHNYGPLVLAQLAEGPGDVWEAAKREIAQFATLDYVAELGRKWRGPICDVTFGNPGKHIRPAHRRKFYLKLTKGAEARLKTLGKHHSLKLDGEPLKLSEKEADQFSGEEAMWLFDKYGPSAEDKRFRGLVEEVHQ